MGVIKRTFVHFWYVPDHTVGEEHAGAIQHLLELYLNLWLITLSRASHDGKVCFSILKWLPLKWLITFVLDYVNHNLRDFSFDSRWRRRTEVDGGGRGLCRRQVIIHTWPSLEARRTLSFHLSTSHFAWFCALSTEGNNSPTSTWVPCPKCVLFRRASQSTYLRIWYAYLRTRISLKSPLVCELNSNFITHDSRHNSSKIFDR